MKNFRYLGGEINCANDLNDAIRRRLQAGNRAIFSNIKLFKSKILSRKVKIKLYESVVRPVVTYGAEIWTLTAAIQSIKRFERRILRIFGPVMIDDKWRIQSNAELEELTEG